MCVTLWLHQNPKKQILLNRNHVHVSNSGSDQFDQDSFDPTVAGTCGNTLLGLQCVCDPLGTTKTTGRKVCLLK